MKQRKYIISLFLFLLIYSCQFVFCQNSLPFSSVENIVGKTVIFPEDDIFKSINNVETKQNAKGKIIILIHYTGCKCELTDLNKWDGIINTKEIIEKEIPLYVIICNVCEYEDDVIINTIHTLNFEYDKFNLIIDSDLVFLKNNTFSSNMMLNTYVIDARNVIQYFGNPTIRKKELSQFLMAINNLY